MLTKKQLIALAIIPQILLVKLLSHFPNLVEIIYSNGIFKFSSKLLHYVFGWIPLSFGDVVYTILGIYALRWLYINRAKITMNPLGWLTDILAVISTVYAVFHVLWAFNYYRLPLHESLNLNTDYSTEELIQVTHRLIKQTNALQLQLAENDSSIVTFKMSKAQLLALVPKGFENLSKDYPHLKYHPKSLKTSLYSVPLTYMGFSGYLNPFTNEAQVDYLLPKFRFPSTASHEVAHQLGYAAENEANFIAYLATTSHTDLYFQYSGQAFALGHCLNDLFKRSPSDYENITKNINTGVLKNFREVREFWESYKNSSEVIFKSSYNQFLKANNQVKGIESYSYVVALIVNYNLSK
ncbi:DUF3810 domain-containing protein [Paucihalobacter ruber]|uniref:DUF3810 domain-containing protein n=1 Tax=Paucihalobacter ruber TaxID=2567861 RepID=A0A506PH27_9FLAO|nr:DUF3810 domain-containing protein [Paucihalobacter ruber]TPV32884.1 DUF3810 domain-containing protein [Paucihalobacter ruber]